MTIKQRQWQLYFLGYYDGKIDGIWGDKSRNATKQFQADYGLWADAIFGYSAEAKSSDVIKKIQKIIGAAVDGLAGEETKTATAKYQKANGLSATGIADKATRAKMGVDEPQSATSTNKTESTAKSGDFWDEIKHFKKSEIKCHCGGKYCSGYPAEPQEKLIRAADKVREHFGKPMSVSSGVRCSRHNSAVGGVSNSRHLSGKAMDFCVSGLPASLVLPYVQSLSGIRYAYAINNNYVHMDIE